MHRNAEDDLIIEDLIKNDQFAENWALLHHPWSCQSYFQNTFRNWFLSNEHRSRLSRIFQPTQLLSQFFLGLVQKTAYFVDISIKKQLWNQEGVPGRLNRLFPEHDPENLRQ